MTEAPGKPPSLKTHEAEALLEHVADVTSSGLPLAAGLRAAAAESSSRRLNAELCQLAAELERGRSLDEVLLHRKGRLSGCLGGLVRAGVRSGKLGIVLVELVDQQRRMRELTRTLRSALAYPTLLLTLALVIGLFLDLVFVGPMLAMFRSFKLSLPYMTEIAGWIHDCGVAWLFLASLATIGGVVLFRWLAFGARWRRVLATVPLLGALWHWSGVTEWTRLMAVLLEQDLPLPEALQLAAAGVHDANLRQLSGQLAQGVQHGRSLIELLTATHRLPASLGPLLGWGERSGQLAEAFRVASDMFEGRVRLRAELLRSILPFVVFVGIGLFALFSVVALYAPMLFLIQGLS